MPNEFTTVSTDQIKFAPSGAEFVTSSADGRLKLYFKRGEANSARYVGRIFDLVEARYDGFSMVTRGSCNHVPSVDAMVELSDPRVAAAREARERFHEAQAALAEARRALRRAEDDLIR